MLTKITYFVKENQEKMVLVIAIILIALLAFFLGYISTKLQEKQPLKIIEEGRAIEKLINI